MTWNCPECFLGGLKVAVESTGKSKCKVTGEQFEAGRPKLAVQSHRYVYVS